MGVENRNPKIFLITGKARHGKDTVARFILDEYKKNGKKGLNLSFASYIKMYTQQITGWDGNEKTKPRAFLQELGTDIIRKKIDELFFINRVCEDIKVYSFFFDVLTISDVRFVKEFEIPEAMFNGVIKIKVIRTGFETDLTKNQQKHQTEIDLDNYSAYDYVINNDGDLTSLNKKVKDILEVIENEH